MSTASTLPATRPLASGRLICGGALSLAMTTILAVAAGGAVDPRTQLAVIAAVASLPGLAWYLIASVDHAKRYDVSILMQWIPVLSAILAAAAFGAWVDRVTPGAGITFFLMVVGIALVSERAEHRAKQKASSPRR